MALSEARLMELAQRLARAMDGDERKGPQLRLIENSAPARQTSRMDAVTKESHLKMIRHFARRYSLQILVGQATFGKGTIDDLDDAELVALHHDLDRARECLADGIALEDAGLIRMTGVSR